jgi:SAM-dependent methyltransferase
MKLLPEESLIWSPIVVNSRMNRERNSSGVNSYEQEFRFRPEEFLKTRIKESGYASWLDLCCGQGKALIQTSEYFRKLGLQEKVKLHGIDLVDTFPAVDKRITCLELESGSLTNWLPKATYDLITCVHGLHYLGDKLKVIEINIKALNPEGLFIANLDLNNIVIQGEKSFLKDYFKKNGINYNSRFKIFKKIGPGNIKFDLKYLGADDEYGTNYTGQDSITSYYCVDEQKPRY